MTVKSLTLGNINDYQNLRFFLTASRLSSWMCSVRGMSFGQTFVQENWV